MCGPTVYDFAHIGNVRPVLIQVFDVLTRCGATATPRTPPMFGITDVDDKINARGGEVSAFPEPGHQRVY